MKVTIEIPRAMAAHARWHGVDPVEYAQFALEEAAREDACVLLAPAPQEPAANRRAKAAVVNLNRSRQ